jgi:hypothetical protein
MCKEMLACFVKQSDGTWQPIKFTELKYGDVFKLVEPDGTPVLYNGVSELMAASDAYFNDEYGEYVVDVFEKEVNKC